MTEQPVGPVDATKVPRFAGLSTFARLPRIEDVTRADVALDWTRPIARRYQHGFSTRSGNDRK